MEYLHIGKKVERVIETLKYSSKQGCLIAQKAESILESISRGETLSYVDITAKWTKYGEKRIKNCRKYDLGAGYRMVAIQRDSDIFIPFMGGHDECHRWLANNSRLREVIVGEATVLPIQPEINSSSDISREDSDTAWQDDLDDDPLEKLLRESSDHDLRIVFSGLIDG